ncbi:MAG: hypothetical protein ACRYGG_21680 [Janthinobacterium lividum]
MPNLDDTLREIDDHTKLVISAGGPGSGRHTLFNKVRDAFLKDFENHGSDNPEAEDINGGDCANYAAVMYQKLDGKAKILSTKASGGHVFLKVGTKYFDATHTKGVSKIGDLDADYKSFPESRFDDLSFDELCKSWKVSKSYLKRIHKMSSDT